MVVVCPKCDVALILLEFGGVEIDYCPKCEGLWLDGGEIEQLLERTGGRPGNILKDFVEDLDSRESGKQAYLCPRCDRAMEEIVRLSDDGSELRIDRCPKRDGLWFDRNELHLFLRSLPDFMLAHGAIAMMSDVLGSYTEETPQGESKI